MDWDPEIDTPASILVIGGGPVGIEAALYARFLGYDVILAEARRIGSQLNPWRHLTLPETWGEATSTLGRAALQAQGAGDLPQLDATITYAEFVDRYLIPVAKTDLLHDSIGINSVVRSVSRLGCGPNADVTANQRAELEFRALIDSRQRGPHSQLVDLVLDCSGLARRPGLAAGGGLAAGESQIVPNAYEVTTGANESSGEHRVIWGDSLEAYARLSALSQQCETNESLRVTWIKPKAIKGSGKNTIEAETPGVFQQLSEQAAQFQSASSAQRVTLTAWGIERIEQREDRWHLQVQTREDETVNVDCDHFEPLDAASADWTFAPPTAAAKLEATSSKCAIATAEPHYYVVGKKSCPTEFLSLEEARHQIRYAFSLIGGRSELDLYATVQPDNL